MIQKCSYMGVLEVFFEEPTKIHFIREISKRISLAPTSVRKHIQTLLKEGMIIKKKGAPFDGFVAYRSSDSFLFYKRAYNLASLLKLKLFLQEHMGPREVRIFGSYPRGEDIEESDIDIILLSKHRKKAEYQNIEERLSRKLHVQIISSYDELEEPLRSNVFKGWVL